MFIFQPDFPEPYYGMKFKWGSNYYLVTNVEGKAGLVKSAEVRRCNNILRFFDEDGNKIYEPCILDQVLRFTNNNDTMTIVTGKAEQYVWCQRNDRTKSIKPNDRFLFGVPEQRIGFRLYAGGLGNSLNTVTGDDNSPSVTQFYIEEYEINYEEDDIVEGFANANRFRYSIDISENNSNIDIGVTNNLSAVVYRGNDVVNKDVIWTSSDESIARIDNNTVIGLSEGSVVITATMKNNTSVHSSMELNVVSLEAQPSYDILISPDINYILEKEEETFVASLYKNGLIQEDSLNIVDVSTDVPKDNYDVIVSGNTFIIKNKKKYLKGKIKIQCSSNNEDISKIFEFNLRGLY